MATKPTVLPEWASAGTNNTEPSLSQKQSGWVPDQDGISDYDNWYKELVWQWCKYLNDGVIEGPLTVSIPGAGDALIVNGDVNITGDTLITGSAVVTGNMDVDGALNYGGRHYDDYVAQVPLMPAPRFSNLGYVGNSEHIMSSSTLWQLDTVSHGAWGLRSGDRIKRFSVLLPVTAAGTYTFNLCKRNAAGVGSIVQAFAQTGVAGSINTGFDITAPVAIAVDERWFIQVLGPNNADELTDIHVKYDHPT